MLESGYIRQRYLNLDKHTDIVFDIRRTIGFITQRLAEARDFSLDKCCQFLPVLSFWLMIGIGFQKLTEVISNRTIIQVLIHSIATQKLYSFSQPSFLVLTVFVLPKSKSSSHQTQRWIFYRLS